MGCFEEFSLPILIFLAEIDLRDALIGKIRSPNFLDSYPPDAECSWKVVARLGHRIRVKFKTFQLGECSNKTCNNANDCDMFEVRDGALNTSKVTGRFCGNRCPSAFFSSGNSLWFLIKSSNRPANGSLGFTAMFRTENVVLASFLPVIACILFLCIFISMLLIILCRRKRPEAFNSSSSFCKPCLDTPPGDRHFTKQGQR